MCNVSQCKGRVTRTVTQRMGCVARAGAGAEPPGCLSLNLTVPVLGHSWVGFLFQEVFDELSGEPAVAQFSLARVPLNIARLHPLQQPLGKHFWIVWGAIYAGVKG